MSNKRFVLLLSALLVGALALSACASPAQSGTTPTQRSITVQGQGKASGAPDVAHINIGVETTGTSAQEALNSNRLQMTALLSKLTEMGIAEKDLQTSNFSIYAERTQPGQLKSDGVSTGNEIITYHVSNMVNVTVRDLAKLGDVLDQAVSAGANNVYGVSFEVSDPSTLEAEARSKAIADAKARATDLAKLSDVSVGDVLQVSEVGGVSGPVYAKASMDSLGGGTPIQPGELEVSLSVQVTYAIK